MKMGYILPPSSTAAQRAGCQSRSSQEKRRRESDQWERNELIASSGLQDLQQSDRKHKTASIQMIVFGNAKDIAPIYSTSLHTDQTTS